jgi:hypothetical protein
MTKALLQPLESKPNSRNNLINNKEMRKFFQNLSGGFVHNGEKKTMDVLKVCMNHDQKLYPNLLANETVVHLNKKYCYICSSKFLKMGQHVQCKRPSYQKKGVRTP